MRKVINPISKTKSKITVGGKVYNNLIEQGYVEVNGTMVKNLKVYDEDTEELVKDFEKQLISDEEDYDTSSDTDSSREFDFDEEEGEFDEYVDYDDNEEVTTKATSTRSRTYDYEEEDIDYASDTNYQPYYQPYNPSMTPVFSRPTQPATYLETLPRIRCHTCSYPVGKLYKSYEEMKKEGYTPEEIFEELEVKRYCCREALEHSQQISTLYGNPNAIYDLPASKTVQNVSKLTKNKYLNEKTSNLTKNKYLSNEKTNKKATTNITTNITRTYERGMPVNKTYYDPTSNIYHYKSLPTRSLAGSKYSVSYIGK
jgi:DNA-directed RNA polymerase subunit N (RpoN/RPB10)